MFGPQLGTVWPSFVLFAFVLLMIGCVSVKRRNMGSKFDHETAKNGWDYFSDRSHLLAIVLSLSAAVGFPFSAL